MLAAVAAMLALQLGAAAQTAAAAKVARVEDDAWSPQVTWRRPDGWYATAIHASLLPDGRVLFIGYVRPSEFPTAFEETERVVFPMTPHALGAVLPPEVTAVPEDVPLDFNGELFFPYEIEDDLFCSGHTLTADGTFVAVGGTRTFGDVVTGNDYQSGLPYATAFDGATWVRAPNDMLVAGTLGTPARWYPACTRLEDGRILVTGGFDLVFPTLAANLSVEILDPADGSWTVASAYGATPTEIANPDYSHVQLLPAPVNGFELLVLGDDGLPVLFAPGGAVPWLVIQQQRPETPAGVEPNNGASSVLLPLRIAHGEWGYANGSVLVAGGGAGTPLMSQAAVFDPVASAWLPPIDLSIRRHHPSTVLLPDGRVLVVSGHDAVTADPGVTRAQYVDPARGFQVSWGRSQESVVRGYHSVALLLPDGRVFVGGGRDHETGATVEKTSFRYYSPGYVKKPRPAITQAPAALTYGAGFPITTAGQAPAEAVLIGLGSMTHSFDMNQRYVQLAVSSVAPAGGSGFDVVLVAPPNARAAPPGHYMLFVLDADRVPSTARIVKLS